MKTIIRHVIRASKEKLTRGAGQFGLFGCDFLLDENFRIWLLEINDNPGVGWGNSRLNTTTKPLFEETLNIVFECFDKYTNGHPLLPIECLKNYQLIYNEDDDVTNLLRDDNQVITERLAIRYTLRESSSRTQVQRLLPRVSTARAIIFPSDHSNTEILLPLVNVAGESLPIPTTPLGSNSTLPPSVTPPADPSADEPIEPLKHHDDLELERQIQPKPVKCSTSFSSPNSPSRPVVKVRKVAVKRGHSTSNTVLLQRKKRIDLTPVVIDNRRYINRQPITPKCTETSTQLEMKPLNRVILDGDIPKDIVRHSAKFDDQSMILSSVTLNLSEISSLV